ncbi:MAG: creatininase family protein [Sulfitobacter sp.]
MQLSHMTWPEVDLALKSGICAILPMGSIEQHGPMGLIGTDAICAAEVAAQAADLVQAIVAPTISYTPAPFNTSFAGTISITAELTAQLVHQVCAGLLDQGFLGVFIVNGHGANLDPIEMAKQSLPKDSVEVESWWAPPAVNTLRQTFYGDWEGMHATPSEVAITQALHGAKPEGDASTPPKQLSAEFIRAHGGDKHGPPDAHRKMFPDGRVGSHSALATPAHGSELLETASRAIAESFQQFTLNRREQAS